MIEYNDIITMTSDRVSRYDNKAAEFDCSVPVTWAARELSTVSENGELKTPKKESARNSMRAAIMKRGIPGDTFVVRSSDHPEYGYIIQAIPNSYLVKNN